MIIFSFVSVVASVNAYGITNSNIDKTKYLLSFGILLLFLSFFLLIYSYDLIKLVLKEKKMDQDFYDTRIKRALGYMLLVAFGLTTWGIYNL